MTLMATETLAASPDSCPPELHKRFMEAEAVVMGTLNKTEIEPIPIPIFGDAKYMKNFYLEKLAVVRGSQVDASYVGVVATSEEFALLEQYASNEGRTLVFLAKTGLMPESAPEDAVKKRGRSWYTTHSPRDVFLADDIEVQACIKQLSQ
ncbi:hypothetical protein DF3PB_310013 [uncultured Defluviicoccus sp.]|uniref:Uncharacterized protein n=1 Tax=metagenome TaxID=256318 RepID=A0A380TDW5_9ZZZZ|nr:hypothetical protein DF3PB_310013 [uncultured Defluviicoccus sp.]